jgi:Ca2+-binding RTX toxin-like protein
VGDKIDLSAIKGLKFTSIVDFSDNSIVQYEYIANWHTNSFVSYNLLSISYLSNTYAIKLPEHILVKETNTGSSIFEVIPSSIFEVIPNKIINGTNTNNSLTGGIGYDTINGLAGNDLLAGEANDDLLVGNEGNDTLIGGLGNDTLTGGSGNDVFKFNLLTDFSDTITDFYKGDKIDLSEIKALHFFKEGYFTGIANQIIQTTDIYYNENNNLVIANKLLIDSNGNKTGYNYIYLPDKVAIKETSAGSLVFDIVENKVLNGTNINNTLIGAEGFDTINGLSGNDSLSGGLNNDILLAGDGNDILIGDAGYDTLIGGAGNDTLIGGLDLDTLTGGSGNDNFKFNTSNDIGTDNQFDLITDFSKGF